MAVKLVTLPNVPIVRVGTYDLSTGEHTFTEEDLVAAANALATDAAVKAPRVRIAAVEEALDLDPAAHGGEPAFGYFNNLKVSDDGQELSGDFHGPEAVADAMQWAYPSLSVEGGPHTSATGRSHDLVITAVALLGVHWPGVTTLDDFTEFLAEGPKIEKTENAPHEVLATTAQRPTPLMAALDQDMVARRLIDAIDDPDSDVELPEGAKPWDLWVRSIRFDDAGKPYAKVTDESSGRLYRVDFKVSGAEVKFGKMLEVVEQDVPVAAGAARPVPPLAVWATREVSRALASHPTTTEDNSQMTDEQRRTLATSFGLDPEKASEADVMAAAAAATPPTTTEPVTPDPQTTPAGDASVPTGITVPEGMVLMDEATLTDLREGAALARATAAQSALRDRNDTISAAVRLGKIPVGRRAAYEAMWGDPTATDPAKRAGDPEGTRQLLAALQPGLVPVEARTVGAAGDGENTDATDAYDPNWLPEVAARKAGAVAAGQGLAPGVRIITEAM